MCPLDDPSCMEGAIERKDVGGTHERSKEWRCYNPNEFTKHTSTALCLSQCDVTKVPCRQGVREDISKQHCNLTFGILAKVGKLHSGGDPELRKQLTIGTLQEDLDRACTKATASRCPPTRTGCAGGSVARKEDSIDRVLRDAVIWRC